MAATFFCTHPVVAADFSSAAAFFSCSATVGTMATGFGSRTVAALKVPLASAVAGFAGTSAATLSGVLAGVTVGLIDAIALLALFAGPLAGFASAAASFKSWATTSAAGSLAPGFFSFLGLPYISSLSLFLVLLLSSLKAASFLKNFGTPCFTCFIGETSGTRSVPLCIPLLVEVFLCSLRDASPNGGTDAVVDSFGISCESSSPLAVAAEAGTISVPASARQVPSSERPSFSTSSSRN
uniref:Uncharacterized protein n=1 Tax=Ixodes ricinus TaxID=34613 RepID=A0A6B0V4M0_IXORI